MPDYVDIKGLRNLAGDQINPATEEKQDRIVTNTDPNLVAAGVDTVVPSASSDITTLVLVGDAIIERFSVSGLGDGEFTIFRDNILIFHTFVNRGMPRDEIIANLDASAGEEFKISVNCMAAGTAKFTGSILYRYK